LKGEARIFSANFANHLSPERPLRFRATCYGAVESTSYSICHVGRKYLLLSGNINEKFCFRLIGKIYFSPFAKIWLAEKFEITKNFARLFTKTSIVVNNVRRKNTCLTNVAQLSSGKWAPCRGDPQF
jgi:methenyltetrahydromethanopterin cyclohydrolase